MPASLPGGPGALAAPEFTLPPVLPPLPLPAADCDALTAAVAVAASKEAAAETTAAGDPAEGVKTPGGTAETEELLLLPLLLLLELEMRLMQAWWEQGGAEAATSPLHWQPLLLLAPFSGVSFSPAAEAADLSTLRRLECAFLSFVFSRRWPELPRLVPCGVDCALLLLLLLLELLLLLLELLLLPWALF